MSDEDGDSTTTEVIETASPRKRSRGLPSSGEIQAWIQSLKEVVKTYHLFTRPRAMKRGVKDQTYRVLVWNEADHTLSTHEWNPQGTHKEWTQFNPFRWEYYDVSTPQFAFALPWPILVALRTRLWTDVATVLGHAGYVISHEELEDRVERTLRCTIARGTRWSRVCRRGTLGSAESWMSGLTWGTTS